MIRCGQKFHLLFHVFTYISEKKGLFSQENNKFIFIKIKSQIDEGLDVKILGYV